MRLQQRPPRHSHGRPKQRRIRRELLFLACALACCIIFVILLLRRQPTESTTLANTNQAMIHPTFETTQRCERLVIFQNNATIPVDPNQLVANHRRLELIHIPKTGGSSLELLAARHNVSWGACHYAKQIFQRPCPSGTKATPHHPGLKRRKIVIPTWHVPIHYYHLHLSPNLALLNPYSNANLVAVVRHPYARLVSYWKYTLRHTDKYQHTTMSQGLMQHLQRFQQATKASSTYFAHAGHLIPQVDFLRNHSTTLFLLRYEYLQEDFNCLMKHYGWNWTLPQERINAGKRDDLTVDNLTDTVKQLAQQIYAEDFQFFQYQP